MTIAPRLEVLALVFAVLVFAGPGDARTGIADDDRVVFYGDLLVQPPGSGAMVEHFVRVRYPSSQVRFWHIPAQATGPGYATAADAAAQFSELVSPLAPTVVVLCVGLGDGGMERYDAQRVDRFASEYDGLLDRVSATGAKVFALTPPMPTVSKKAIMAANRYDETIAKIAEAVCWVCQDKNVPVLDWFGALSTMAAAAGAESLTASDGLTPTPLSESVAARLILEAWKLEPIDVTVKVDWSADTAESSAGTVTLKRIDDRTVRLSLRDFPMPLYTGLAGWTLRDDFACSAYSRIMLKLANLPKGQVSLSESGTPRAYPPVPHTRFADGYNLAIDGPLAHANAVRKLAELITDKNRSWDLILQFRRMMKSQPPEPELVESYKTHLLARKQHHDGTVKIIRRTPRTVDLDMNVTLAPATSGK